MANIRKNRDVKKHGDVQNVITSAILRTQGMFSKEDIYQQVENAVKFSCYGKYGKKRNQIDIQKMIDDTIETLWIIDCIKYFESENKYKLSMGFPALQKMKNNL